MRDKVVSNLTRTLPTLELGDPSKPALFFLHGWPDSAAEFAAQFAGLCYGPSAKYRCVAVTMPNFHPDLPSADKDVLTLNATIDRIVTTVGEANCVDTTFVVHDWGSVIGYMLMSQHPDLMKRTISFDVGTGGNASDGFMSVNAEAYLAKTSLVTKTLAKEFWAPCTDCATWESAWVYCPTPATKLSACSIASKHVVAPPATNPFLFVWGNMTRGKPRTWATEFFGPEWLEWVEATPHGQVVVGTGDHWVFAESAAYVNEAIENWLAGLM